ncbi:MAG: M20/M25/M40 family metallo-hydrolase [Halobacteriales archaeon]
MTALTAEHEALLEDLSEGLLRYESTDGEEGTANRWLQDRLAELGFRTVSWDPDPNVLREHPSFPPVDELDLDDRPSVAGILEFGDPRQGHTLVLNGHVDVGPVEREHWSTDPFDPSWAGDRLHARGAVDMKSQVAACIVGALTASESATDLDGRIVVESVAGEERGGFGAVTAAASNPYEFERDAAIVAEPTDERLVTATAGAAMVRLTIDGRSAHGARRWQGVDVLDHFEDLRAAIRDLESERAEQVTHPGYERFDLRWPTVIGRVEAGNWASNVPARLEADARLGVAPGETVAEVVEDYRDRLATAVQPSDWLREHPPSLQLVDVQFEPAEVSAEEPIVGCVQEAMTIAGLTETTPVGETYGADSRHYVDAGIPTVLFGPGRIEDAHFPNESIQWPAVERAVVVYAEAIKRFLGGT